MTDGQTDGVTTTCSLCVECIRIHFHDCCLQTADLAQHNSREHHNQTGRSTRVPHTSPFENLRKVPSRYAVPTGKQLQRAASRSSVTKVTLYQSIRRHIGKTAKHRPENHQYRQTAGHRRRNGCRFCLDCVRAVGTGTG